MTPTKSMTSIESILARATLLCLATMILACSAKHASVAVNPISGKVFVSHEDTLQSCDQAAETCTSHKLGMKPISAVAGPDGRLVFLTSSAIYRCDDAGQGCTEARLPIDNPVAVGVAASGQVVVVSNTGHVVLCNDMGCQKVGK